MAAVMLVEYLHASSAKFQGQRCAVVAAARRWRGAPEGGCGCVWKYHQVDARVLALAFGQRGQFAQQRQPPIAEKQRAGTIHLIGLLLRLRPSLQRRSAAAAGASPLLTAFVSAPHSSLLAGARLTLARLAEHRLLVRERGSGTRSALELLFKKAGLRLRIGSELSSNEAIKQMCAAGFGPAYLSLQTCILELDAGLLKVLPMADNPTEREWHVVHLSTRQLPQVVLAFEQFMRREEQAKSLRAMWQHLVPAPRRRRWPAVSV